MKRIVLIIFVCVVTLVTTLNAKAQIERPFTGQIALDLRSFNASGGRNRSGVYGAELNVQGKLGKGWRVHFEGAQNNAKSLTTAGAVFNQFITQQANVEYLAGKQSFSAGVVRLPFGLYDHRETYASGLIDYPLLRGDSALQALDWGVTGAKYTGFKGNTQWETSAFGGTGAGMWGNQNNVSGIASRLQTYYKGVIVGLSRWDGSTSTAGKGQEGTHLTGVDVRYTRPHLLLRGEYMAGDHAGQKSHGFSIDAFYHLPKFERWTLSTRWEAFQPSTNTTTTRQLTVGVRYTLSKDWMLALNWRKNNGPDYSPSWTPSSRAGGDFYFQAYRKVGF